MAEWAVKKGITKGRVSHPDEVDSNTGPVSLCSPDDEKSCFACCPPIRPAGYEHKQYESIIKRILSENTHSFQLNQARAAPITGFSCWALGYTDKACRRVGCLLHPNINQGVDRRYKTGYEQKCRRESCPEAIIFASLSGNEQRLILRLAEGLDSFEYSSKQANPIFQIINWGKEVLHSLASELKQNRCTRHTFLRSYPFFLTKLSPRAHAYLLNRLLAGDRPFLLKKTQFREKFEAFSIGLSQDLLVKKGHIEKGLFVHRLGLDPLFSDFLRLAAGRQRVSGKADALALKAIVDNQIERFKGEII